MGRPLQAAFAVLVRPGVEFDDRAGTTNGINRGPLHARLLDRKQSELFVNKNCGGMVLASLKNRLNDYRPLVLSVPALVGSFWEARLLCESLVK